MMVNYTSYQTIAIATLLSAALWGVAIMGAEIRADAVTTTQIAIFGTLLILAWVLVPVYWMRARVGYVAGIIVWATAMIGLTALPVPPPWYEFTAPVYDFSVVIFYAAGLCGIYCSYKSFQETKTAGK